MPRTQSQKRGNLGDSCHEFWPRRWRCTTTLSFQQNPRSLAPAYAEPSRPSLVSTDSRTNVSFQNTGRSDRNSQFNNPRQHSMPPCLSPLCRWSKSPEFSNVSKVCQKKSLVRPDHDSGPRQWPYRSHIAQLEQEGNVRVGIMPSSAFAESFTPTHLIDFFLPIQ